MNNRIIILVSLTFFTGYSQGSSVIWTVEKITFSKLALGDADALTSNVTLMRGANSGLYNNVSETENTSISPADTRWAYGTTQDDLSSLSFDTFKNAVGQGNQGNKPPMGSDLVLHLVTDDIYMDITFLTWETNGNYSYERSSSNGIGILLNGTVSAESNQIKNVADPTDNQDAATKSYVDSNVNAFSGSYNDLTDKPAGTYTQSEVDAIISDLQNQINDLKPSEDVDGNTNDFTTYGDQTWSVENAEVVTYRNGTTIPQVTDATEWSNLTTGAWCYYENDSSKGKLYNWYAVMGIHDAASLTDASLRKAFAPEGWHVPTDAEWTTLEEYLIANGYNHDGTTTGNKIAKAMASTTGWNSSTTAGAPGKDQSLNNSSGFNLFPEGDRGSSGSFHIWGYDAIFWSSTEYNTGFAMTRNLYSNDSILDRTNNSKRSGFSVRFVRD